MDAQTTAAVAAKFTRLCREGKDGEAGERFWAPDVVSIEATPSEMARLQGPEAIRAKHAWWYENVTLHAAEVEGPFVNGDMFAVIFRLDVTMKGAGRQKMEEVALYTVRDGKVVEERFLEAPG